MLKVIEHAKGHYDAQEVEFGTVYRWFPESVVVWCDCGGRASLTASATTCGECGVDHKAIAREELADERLEDEALRPWRH